MKKHHRRTEFVRKGMSSRAAVVGAVLWCAVIISVVLSWDPKPAKQENPIPTEESDRLAAARPDPLRSSDQATQAIEDNSSDEDDDNQSTAGTITLRLSAPEIPDFALLDSEGGEFGLSDLNGRPWVASFIFTRCALTCPQITLAMKKLHDRVKDQNPDVMFVSFTVDSDYDTIEIMHRYSETFQPDRERWRFLTGDMQEMHDLIINGIGLYVKENIGELRRPGMEVAHSNQVVLVNEQAKPVGKYLGTNDAEMAELAQVLTGRKPFPKPTGPAQILRPGDGPEGVEIEIVPVNSDDETNSPPATPNDDANESGPTQEKQSLTISRAGRVARIEKLLPKWAQRLPTVNAVLNSTATILLAAGFIAIRRHQVDAHRNFMLSAFVISIGFLGCYLTSHWAMGHYTGERGRPFLGEGSAVAIYRLILWPHIVLAATVPFLSVRVIMHAFAERREQHRRLARITFPIWMYVSVTGVVIYGMLYHWPGSS